VKISTYHGGIKLAQVCQAIRDSAKSRFTVGVLLSEKKGGNSHLGQSALRVHQDKTPEPLGSSLQDMERN
jgi:hypothetical protein